MGMIMLRKALGSQYFICKSLAKRCFYSGYGIWACHLQNTGNKKNKRDKGHKKNKGNNENRDHAPRSCLGFVIISRIKGMTGIERIKVTIRIDAFLAE